MMDETEIKPHLLAANILKNYCDSQSCPKCDFVKRVRHGIWAGYLLSGTEDYLPYEWDLPEMGGNEK